MHSSTGVRSHHLPLSVYGPSKSDHTQSRHPIKTQYLSTECVLFGSIFNKQKDQLIQRLKGLCDPDGAIPFFEHNMSFKLSAWMNENFQT